MARYEALDVGAVGGVGVYLASAACFSSGGGMCTLGRHSCGCIARDAGGSAGERLPSDAVLPEEEKASSEALETLYPLPEGYRFRSGALWKDGTVTDIFMDLPRYVRQRQPEGLRLLPPVP